MRIAALLPLLPLALASPAHRRQHSRAHALAVADANRPLIQRAGATVDNGTLASISADAASSAATATTATVSDTATSTDAVSSVITTSVLASSSIATSSSSIISSAVTSTQATSTVLPSTSTQESSTEALSSTSTSLIVVPSTSSSTVLSSSTASSTAAVVITSTASSSTPSSTTEAAATTSTTASEETSSTEDDTTTSSTSASSTAHSTVVLTTTESGSSSSSSSTSTSSSDSSDSSSSGLSKSALIAIIVVASIVGLAVIGWTAFRKWKLKNNRFDSKMQPIDFSPQNDGMDDDFFEKTLQRSASQSSNNRQRQELVAELDDPNHVPGVPSHDFTAGAGIGAYGYHDGYPDQYEYDEYAQYDPNYDPNSAGYEHAYPPQPAHALPHGYDYSAAGGIQEPDTAMTAQSDGYADLQRGLSIGSGSGHGHGLGQSFGEAGATQPLAMPMPMAHEAYSSEPYAGEAHAGDAYAAGSGDIADTRAGAGSAQGLGHVGQPELQFPSADHYNLGRPTGGSDGPYAQAATYRY